MIVVSAVAGYGTLPAALLYYFFWLKHFNFFFFFFKKKKKFILQLSGAHFVFKNATLIQLYCRKSSRK